MKEDNQKTPPTKPAHNNTEPAPQATAAENDQQVQPQNNDEADEGYVVVGSGLGIDE